MSTLLKTGGTLLQGGRYHPGAPSPLGGCVTLEQQHQTRTAPERPLLWAEWGMGSGHAQAVAQGRAQEKGT